jgi:hypothetical protein
LFFSWRFKKGRYDPAPFSSLNIFKTIFFLFYSILFSLISSVFISGRFCHIGWQEDRDQCQGLNAKNAVIANCCSSQTRATGTGKTTVANPHVARPAKPAANIAGFKSQKTVITSGTRNMCAVSNAGVPRIRATGAANPEKGAMRYKIP